MFPKTRSELAVQVRTYQHTFYQIHDLFPDIDSAMADVETNVGAANVTAATVYDVLCDFATQPEGIDDEQYHEMLWVLACDYTGTQYIPVILPDPEFWQMIAAKYPHK